MQPTSRPLVSIALPVYNGEDTIVETARSALDQQYGDVELVISDNASGDGTEEICRELARDDSRVSYHRSPDNVGVVRNFMKCMRLARGDYIRWLGHDDWIAPSYVSRCLDVFAQNERLVLVTTQLEYQLADDRTASDLYDGSALQSGDPVTRFGEMLRLQTRSYTLLDPMYGLMRRETPLASPQRMIMRTDEIFAAELALAGPWGHIPEILARRRFEVQPAGAIARKLGTPRWQARFANLMQCRELMHVIAERESTGILSAEQARLARAEVRRLYVRRWVSLAERARRKAVRVAVARATRSTSRPADT